ncbi:vanadium-dependent haloperoxidase [Opitutus terrae]|uniref:Phosphoesterase PA-phosphatase related n=1 Tax=Opitutus terrae (strain DSM 11246 / JCM 15787 / PB90-1) TaxID=452637 RepID=B1ZQJ8_OPITP|nr:vanadium-dependent haloperoxidase [Opitutus terrae]ACB75607.1 phosphoesterase PA-phosphatase related [Opitutus terrae PB90-1]
MRSLRFAAVVAAAGLLLQSSASANNAVLDWNEHVLNTTRLSRLPPPPISLFIATYHIAIFDAVNGITRTHQPWLVDEVAPAGADMDAAIASAAHTVLLACWGQSTNPRNHHRVYEETVAKIPDGPGKTAGIAWGKHVAEAVLAKRASCGFDKPIPGPYSSQDAGKWRETPPGFRPATLPHWAKVTPFAMTSPSQFRAPPPPALDSEQCAKELAEIVKIGARDNAERTEYQTLSVAFWSDDLGTCTPPGHWNIIAADLARRYKLSVPETARLFALLNIAEADACISSWDTKFFYSTWRPETAIRELETARNAHWKPQPEFIPLMMSPSFPSYVSGHSTFSAAAARVLERFFGTDEIEFTTTSDGLPGAVRTFKRLSECRDEIGMSRLYGGFHVMADNVEGQKCGIKVADWVMENSLQPRSGAMHASN